jgi:hypothetical protein
MSYIQEKIMKQPTPNKLKPKTTFEGIQTIDESTNYDRFHEDPTDIRPGNSVWDRAWKAIKGSKTMTFGIPGLGGHKK